MWLLIAGLLGLIQPATDLHVTAQVAREARLPVLLYVSRSDCSFCRRFEVDVLNPLIRSGAIADEIIVRELVWDAPDQIRDFSGNLVTPAAMAEAYHAKLTPTLLFLDFQGNEVVQRITGYRKSDYFSYYLETAVAKAAFAVKQPHPTKRPRHDR